MSLIPRSRSQLRLFENPYLEALTVIHAPAFIGLWMVILSVVLAIALLFASTLSAPLLVLAGFLVWTVTEYVLHRFVFHFDARSEVLKRIIFIIHGNHHADPSDPLRNLMPPVVSAPVGALVWYLSVSGMGPGGTWFFLGFISGYVIYDLVHYACHQWPMKGRAARLLKVHHMRHHHLRARGNYAVTSTAWDRLLSTRIGKSQELI